MKVRITKSGKKTYWYSNRIGEEFEVTQSERYSESYQFKNNGILNFIDKVDCEILQPTGENDFDTQALSPQEEPNDKLFQAAVAAMQGMLANEGIRQIFCGNNGLHAIDIMPYAWDYAEALINEGKKRGHL